MKLKVFLISTVSALALLYIGVSVYIASVLTTPGQTPIEFDRSTIGERVADVTFASKDGVQLAGWYFRGVNDKAIIFVHGAGNQNRVNEIYGTPEIARHFHDKGYTVLMFDLRGFGESQKTRMSFGQHETNDVAGAFNYLVTQEFDPRSIAIISNSMGAITTIMASDDVKNAGAIVLDSPATHIKDITSNIMRDENSVPDFLHPGIFLAAKLFYNVDIEKVRPIDSIEKLSNTPTLFLHGENDTLIPPDHTKLLSESLPNSQRVTFPNTAHVETYKNNNDQYLDLVSKFLDDKLVSSSP